MKGLLIAVGILALIFSANAAYSPSVAREMAYMSAIAYDSVLNVQAWNCKLCQEYKIALPKPFYNLSSGVRGFTGYSSSLSSIVVSFKGADSINTFINELKTARETFDKCEGCEVSKSFNELYLTVQPSVLSNIESLHRIYRNAGIYITGHGLGGAFAILAATDITQLYQTTDAVYTFGQPRVGNEQFATYYSKTLPSTYRVIHYADIVPHLPATSAGYLHSSLEEWYQTDMKSYKTCEGESSACSNSISPQSWSISDNNITNYINIGVGSPQLLTQDN